MSAHDAERRDAASLIPAWRGLRKIIAVPCTGEFTRRVGSSGLLMTAATHEDSETYRRALSSFV